MSMWKGHQETRGSLILLLLGLPLLLLIYAPLFSDPAEFVGDDYYYIVQNPLVNQGSLETLGAIWVEPMEYGYTPVTVTSFALDFAFFGPAPKRFHLTNVLLFLLAVLTAWSLAIRLCREAAPGEAHFVVMAAILVMALHPVNVESVAGIANRKELLYTLFGLLAIRVHVSSVRGWLPLLATPVLVVMAQFSKETGVIIPLVLVAYDILCRKDSPNRRRYLFTSCASVLVAGLVFCIQLSLALESQVVAREIGLTFGGHLGGVIRTLDHAAWSLLFPVGLSYDYDVTWPDSLGVLGVEWISVVLLALLVGYLAIRRKRDDLFFVALIAIPFLPYANIVPLKHRIAGQLVCYDHYLLFSTLAGAAWLAHGLLGLSVDRRRVACAAVLALAAAFAAANFHLAQFWKTQESLYVRLIDTAPDLSRPHLYLGKVYLEQRRYEEARKHLAEGLGLLLPGGHVAIEKIGEAKLIRGEKRHLTEIGAMQMLGNACAFSGRYHEAELAYRAHLRYAPRDTKTLQNLSSTLIMLGQKEAARRAIQRWLFISPDDPAALKNLTLVESQRNPD